MDNSVHQIDNNLLEIRSHGTREYPFAIYQNIFANNHLSYISCHWHPEIEIAYVEEGEIEFTVNEKIYNLKEGQAMLIWSNQFHSATKLKHDAMWKAIVINPKLIYGFEESIIKSKYFSNAIYKNVILSDYHVNVVRNICNLYETDDPNKEIKINALLLNLYGSVVSSLDKIDLSMVSQTSSFRLKLVLDYIYCNYSKKIKIEDICHEVSICRSEVCKLFKEKLNTTFTEYLTKLRIEKSVQYLLSAEANISQISELVGFNSSSYFAETFKKFFNITPMEYRKIHYK